MLNLKNCLLLLCSLSTLPLFGQDYTSTIDAITIFRNRARVQRSAQINLEAGKNTIYLNELSTKILSNTIQIKLSSEDVFLEKFVFETDYLSAASDPDRVKTLKDSINIFQDQLLLLSQEKEVLLTQESVLKANQQLPTSLSANSTEELKKLVQFQKEQSLSIKTDLNKIKKEQSAIEKKKTQYQQQVRTLQGKRGKHFGYIVLDIEASQAMPLNVSFSYLVSGASWDASYDIFSKGVNENLNVTYQAEVRQSTGIDWTEIPLSLSNGNPFISNNPPNLVPQYARIELPIKVDTISTFDPETYEEKFQIVRNEVNVVDIEEAQTNVVFRMPKPYSIPSDNQKYKVQIGEYDIPATYEFMCIPKKSLSAFLIAKVTDYSKYYFISGSARLFYENNYIGNSYINSASTNDTLELSLGVDQNIIIERNRSDFSSKKWMGSKKSKEVKTNIRIRNNKSVAINIRVKDQIPISTDKAIEISLDQKDGARFNANKGFLEWDVKIAPSKTEEKTFIYQIKSPKNKPLYGG
jgi:uncharacterized protein (TIGR02231 family)